MPSLGPRCATPSLTQDARSVASDASGIVPARWSRDQAFMAPCPHLETASAARHDGAARTDAIVTTPARPLSSSIRISHRRRAARAFRKHLARASAAPVNGMPGDLLRANASHPFEPRWSRLLSARIYTTARQRRDPGMPRTDDRRAPHRDLASDSRGQIAIIDCRQPCAGLRAGAPRLSDRLIMRRANSCRLRRVPGLALNFLYIARRGADCVRLFCQFFLPKKCARITLYFGWYALDTRDRLGP